MNREDASGLTDRTVTLQVSDWIAKTKQFPTTLLLARVYRMTLKAVLLAHLIDGETGEILTYDGETVWVPFSQIDWMNQAPGEPGQPELPIDYSFPPLDAPIDKLKSGPFVLKYEPDDWPEDDEQGDPENFTELVQRGQLEVGPVLMPVSPAESPEKADAVPPPIVDPVDRLVWATETFGDARFAALPEPTAPYEPRLVSRAAVAGNQVSVGEITINFYKDQVEITAPGPDMWPLRLSVADGDLDALCIGLYLATATLDNVAEQPCMAMTIAQIEKVRAALKRVDDLSKEAIEAIEKDQRWHDKDAPINKNRTPATGSKQTGALKRASLDLTRTLADLRRPG